jgi:hypothetical protein
MVEFNHGGQYFASEPVQTRLGDAIEMIGMTSWKLIS